MKYVSLFAGIGGFDLALNRLGHECVYANEWDKYSAQIYEKNFGHKPDTRDIKTVGASEIPDHDIIVGGFPCQAFSIAGKRRGFEDTRGTLFHDICRIIKVKKPRILLLENVKGLLSHDSGKTFATIIVSLDELGYNIQWQVLNSKDFGVPQNRERVFIVGHIRTEPRPQVFPIAEISGLFDAPDESKEGWPPPQLSTTVRSNPAKKADDTYIVVGTLRTHKDGNGFRKMKSGFAPTIPARAREDGSGQPVIMVKRKRNEFGKAVRKDYEAGKLKVRRMDVRDWEEIPQDHSNTLSTVQIDNLLKTDMRIRRLTPVECERLMGFPDNWTEGVSDTQRYKMCGNAVVVNVVEAVASLL